MDQSYTVWDLENKFRLMAGLRPRSVGISGGVAPYRGLINKRRLVIHRSSPKLESAVALVRELAGTKKCVLFAMDIATCERIYERISGTVPAFIVHSDLKDQEVKQSLQAFRAAQTGVLIAR